MPHITIVNRRDGEHRGATYCGRPSPLGNPFRITQNRDRDASIKAYRALLTVIMSEFPSARSNKHRETYEALQDLIQQYEDGNDLVLECWCAPRPCHCEVIKEVILERCKEQYVD